ncbi:MAG: hypothetical protein ACRYE7_00315 [Janthinobacterium lividum]
MSCFTNDLKKKKIYRNNYIAYNILYVILYSIRIRHTTVSSVTPRLKKINKKKRNSDEKCPSANVDDASGRVTAAIQRVQSYVRKNTYKSLIRNFKIPMWSGEGRLVLIKLINYG